jgi:hypothetical protein
VELLSSDAAATYGSVGVIGTRGQVPVELATQIAAISV